MILCYGKMHGIKSGLLPWKYADNASTHEFVGIAVSTAEIFKIFKCLAISRKIDILRKLINLTGSPRSNWTVMIHTKYFEIAIVAGHSYISEPSDLAQTN